MAKITLKGNPIDTSGELPAEGSKAPSFKLTNGDLEDIDLSSYAGSKLVLNIFPSIDTPVCATSVKKFHEQLAQNSSVKVLCISADLPFATKRFCAGENIESVSTLSTFRNPDFGKDYGIMITSGPLSGLLARAVVVLDEEGKVIYKELVPEIAEEPNYEKALNALASA